MITTKRRHLKNYLGIHPNLDAVIDYIQTNDLSNLKMGTTQIKGDDIYVNHFHYTTMPKEDGYLEAHRVYLDIHVVLSGEEYIGYCDIQDTQSLQPFDVEGDFHKLSGNIETLVYMDTNNICITWLEDAHQPKIQVTSPCLVDKLVFKVRID